MIPQEQLAQTGPVRTRSLDRYGRPIYLDSEIPPADAGLSVWQGNVVTSWPPTPGNSVGGCHPHGNRKPYATCFEGWVRSGDWWLHCSDCHPPDMDHYAAELDAFRASSTPDPLRRWVPAGDLRHGQEILWLGTEVPSPVLSVRHLGREVIVRHRDHDGVTYERRWSARRPVPVPR